MMHATRMKCENIIVREIGDTQKTTCCMNSFTCSVKNGAYLQGQNAPYTDHRTAYTGCI